MACVIICDNYCGGMVAMALPGLPLSWKYYYAITIIPAGYGVALEKAAQINNLI